MDVGLLLDRQAQARPHKIAVVAGAQQRTYRQLNQRANQLANALFRLGIKKGDRVGVLLPNVVEYIEIYFALAKLGAIMVLVNWRQGHEEIRFVLQDADACALIVDQSRCPEMPVLWSQLPTLRTIMVVGSTNDCPFISYQAAIAGESPQLAVDVTLNLDDDQLLLYTSGTTGTPKGAVITHENTMWNSFNQILDLDLTRHDSTLVVCPLFHVSGLYDLTFPLLHVGGTVFIANRFDAGQALATIAEHRITTVMTVPTMIYDWLKLPDIEAYDRTSLRLIVCGGAPLPTRIIEDAMARLSPNFVQGYGLTEGTSVSTFLPSEEGLSRMGSIGKPFMHVELSLLNDAMTVVGPGEIGEIAIKGKTVVRGYWNLPDETRRSFRQGWFLTGDLARQDEDGFLYLVDRKKNMIISGGENIYPKELEDLLAYHPAVLEAAVIGVPDERWGEVVMAVVVVRPGHSLSADEVVQYCGLHLASYKKPHYVRFVDDLLRNATGKVLKEALRKQMMPTIFSGGAGEPGAMAP